MPLQISEITVQLAVDGASPKGEPRAPAPHAPLKLGEAEMEEMIERCAQAVLDRLNRGKGR